MALSAQELSYRYNRQAPAAINHCSVEIAPGERVVLAGPNGSGKSTLLKLLAGIYLPDQGSVQVDGIGSHRQGRMLPGVGLVMANPERFFFAATVEEEIAFGLHNQGVKPNACRDQVVQALGAVGLNADFLRRNPFFLSLGEQRKVGIASILALQPRYLLLDEPFSNLDVEGNHSLVRYLHAYAAAGHAVLISSHRAQEVSGWCQRLIVLDQGRVYYDGGLAAWQQTPQLPVLLGEAAYLRHLLADRGWQMDYLDSPQEIAAQLVQAWTAGGKPNA